MPELLVGIEVLAHVDSRGSPRSARPWAVSHIQAHFDRVDTTVVNQGVASEQTQPSRITSIIIFAVLVLSAISGAVFAQFAPTESIPDSIGQPDTGVLQASIVATSDPLAFAAE